MHHPYFIPQHSKRWDDNRRRNEAFAPVIKKHAVDLVAVGHFHFYLRSTAPRNVPTGPRNVPAAPNDERTSRAMMGTPQDVRSVFTISSSGAGVSPLPEVGKLLQQVGDGLPETGLEISFDRVAGNSPMFQVVQVDDGRLTYRAYTAVGDIYDEFTLEKNGETKTLTNGPPAFGDFRLFQNTGPYRSWRELR